MIPRKSNNAPKEKSLFSGFFFVPVGSVCLGLSMGCLAGSFGFMAGLLL
jgi:hypothetical protein